MIHLKFVGYAGSTDARHFLDLAVWSVGEVRQCSESLTARLLTAFPGSFKDVTPQAPADPARKEKK